MTRKRHATLLNAQHELVDLPDHYHVYVSDDDLRFVCGFNLAHRRGCNALLRVGLTRVGLTRVGVLRVGLAGDNRLSQFPQQLEREDAGVVPVVESDVVGVVADRPHPGHRGRPGLLGRDDPQLVGRRRRRLALLAAGGAGAGVAERREGVGQGPAVAPLDNQPVVVGLFQACGVGVPRNPIVGERVRSARAQRNRAQMESLSGQPLVRIVHNP
jgi:hypothetical protein